MKIMRFCIHENNVNINDHCRYWKMNDRSNNPISIIFQNIKPWHFSFNHNFLKKKKRRRRKKGRKILVLTQSNFIAIEVVLDFPQAFVFPLTEGEEDGQETFRFSLCCGIYKENPSFAPSSSTTPSFTTCWKV